MVSDSPVSAVLALTTRGFYYFNALLTELPAILLWSFSFVQNAASLLKSATVPVLLLHWQIAFELPLCCLKTLMDKPLGFVCFSLSLVLWDLPSSNVRTVKFLKLYSVASRILISLQLKCWCILSALFSALSALHSSASCWMHIKSLNIKSVLYSHCKSSTERHFKNSHYIS